MSQPSTRRRRLVVPLIIVASLLLISAVSFIIGWKFTGSRSEQVYGDASGDEGFQDASFESRGKWYGLCAKNSVRTIDDFRRTVSEDQTLRTHFAGFRWEKASIEKLEKPMAAYVSFRNNEGNIFRKKTPIKLPAGDEYITDGEVRIRTHCCNDYTAAPSLQEAVATDPDDPGVLEPSEVEVVASVKEMMPPLAQPVPRSATPLIASKEPARSSRGETTSVPEPTTLLMVAAGVPVFLYWNRLRRKRK